MLHTQMQSYSQNKIFTFSLCLELNELHASLWVYQNYTQEGFLNHNNQHSLFTSLCERASLLNITQFYWILISGFLCVTQCLEKFALFQKVKKINLDSFCLSVYIFHHPTVRRQVALRVIVYLENSQSRQCSVQSS